MQSEFASSMFSDDISVNKRNVLFIAAGSLGIPLALSPASKNSGWNALREDLEMQFLSKPFDVVSITHHPETFFPLGSPLSVRSSHLFDIFNLKQFQGKARLLPENYKLDHVIWICPSGIVLIIGKISFDDDATINLEQLNEIVFENHYAELGYVFNEIAEVVINTLPESFLSPPLCNEKDINRIREDIFLRKQLGSDANNAQKVIEWLVNNEHAQQTYANSIIDVYFVDYHPVKNTTNFQITYFKSIITSPDPSYVLMVCIAYSSFVGLLWLVKHLEPIRKIVERGDET